MILLLLLLLDAKIWKLESVAVWLFCVNFRSSILAHELVEHCEYSQTVDETRDWQTIVICLAYGLLHSQQEGAQPHEDKKYKLS